MSDRIKTLSARLAQSAGAIAGAAMLLGLSPASASATTLTFDFGLLGANGGSPCASNCVLPGLVENDFTTGGVTVGAIGYMASGAVGYTTQKPGPFAADGGETGLGESDTYPHPSDGDYEVTTHTYLLINNAQAFAKGYQSSTFSIESIQNGEGAKIYAYTGSLTALDPTKLSLLDTISAPATGGVTQTFSVPINSLYLVVQAFTPPGGSAAADIVVAQEVLNTAAVPEPSTWALLLVGLGGLGASLRAGRKTVTAAA